VAAGTAIAIPVAMLFPSAALMAQAAVAPVGEGFTVSPSDLAYILKQIKIAERHAATLSPAHPCDTLIGTGPDQIASPLVSFGLRTVDGSCNNLQPGQETFGAADQKFPRLATPVFKAAENSPAGFGPTTPSTYAQKKGNVFDSEPRVVSNLIVDQTSTNPAAIAAAGNPVRTQGSTGVVPCTTDPDPLATPPVIGVPADCVPSHTTLFIPNVTTDVGLSPPYNSMFTLFGQFFDHGVDQTVKGGGTVFVPLRADDPLRTLGPDGKPTSGDEVPASQAFMVMTRAQNQPGQDGVLGDNPATPVDESLDDVQDANNTDSPWVDQSQTYTSHASHQVFLREYANNANGRPVSTGKLLGGPAGPTAGGMATWATTKAQASALLGIKLLDKDVLNVPMLAADPYGKFIPGPARGLPQFVTSTGLVEANRADNGGTGTLVPANVRYFDTPFLTDIAHNADPSPQDTDRNPATPPVAPTPDPDTTASADFASQAPGTYDDEMLNAHFIAGDGRVNENIGLTAIHQIFHSEHDRLVGDDTNPAVGSIIMGMSDQVGNELDEFVTETLRNNLLGLPLDLATINMARARSEGIPRLNVLRREIFNSTNDGQLQPYVNWVEFGENLKHPESLVNFVAAYGLHPTITAATTVVAKREAARLIVSPNTGEVPPADAAAFMTSTGAWANAGTSSITGLDNVDLWVGGLAERTNLFGGLLGSTFNYVFEKQLTDLQNGDRLYYLARTPGMNLRAQLEGNSFAELIMRNTNAHSLKADAFATADCKFELKNLAGTAAGFAASGGTVADDPSSDCSETDLLIRMPDGTIKYRARNTVDPAGINGQSVYNGTAGVDRVYGGNDNDTFWGGAGNDIIEGGDGADIALGGEGNDIITDLAGDDVPKGGPGNDAIDAGPGLDIVMGGDGNDFTNGGANINETFAGSGDDFVIAGQGEDAVFGDSGDDWQEGGDQPDLLQGDSGNLFFLDDSQKPGHDVLIGQGGDDDYDMEGGDDIGVAGPGIEKVAGASGYDWEIGQSDPQPQDADLALPILPLDILQVGVRDKFNEVEALSGANLDDKLRGDDIVPSQRGGGGFIGCDVLDQNGVNRVAGLNRLLPALATPLAGVIAASASKDCPVLSGTNVWGDGNILLGGAGNDTIEGRGADDIIDGDKALSVRISVRNSAGAELGSTDLMENTAKSGTFGAGTTGMTLQQAVFAGLVDPGNLVTVREVTAGTAAPDCSATTPAPTATSVNCDTAVFSGPLSNYSITSVAASGTTLASIRVTQTGADVVGQKVSDGVDTLRNIELLKFSDQTVPLTVPNAPTNVSATASAGATTTGTATVNWTAPAATASPITSFTVVVRDGATVVQTITGIPATATSRTVTGLVNGTTVTLSVSAVTALGNGPEGTSNAVTPRGLPGAPTGVVATAGNAQATVNWVAPASDGGSAITGYTVVVRRGTTLVSTSTVAANLRTFTATGLTNGSAHTFTVNAVNAFGPSTAVTSNTVTPIGGVPGAPRTVTATATSGATTTGAATISWLAPLPNGSAPITSYTVVIRVGANVVRTVTGLAPTATSSTQTGLSNGTTYTLSVNAVNAAGSGAQVAAPAVTPRGLPGTPTGVTATPGPNVVTVRWVAPSNGGSAILRYEIVITRNNGTVNVGTVTAAPTATSFAVTGISNGLLYTFRVRAVNALGTGALSAAVSATPRTVPGAPVIGTAASGVAGGAITATANWTAPASTGGSPITGYRVSALRMSAAGAVLATTVVNVGPTVRTVSPTLVAGNYRFSVQAVNVAGTSASSARSNLVTAR
jgi:Ca2+-binding RTX toxin-like protein